MNVAGTPPRQDQVLRGICYMVGATVLLATVNVIVKWELALYPVGEVAFFRSLFALVPCYLLILPRAGLGVLRTKRLADHFKRAVSQLCSMTGLFLAFHLMPLASAIAISFSSPLFTTLLSIVILKEKVGLHRWSALILGFIGVLLVTRPDAGTLQLGALFALVNAVLISTVAIAIRRMSATESTETLTIYQLSMITVFTALMLPFGFSVPAWRDGVLMALAGLVNGVGQYWWTRALYLAPPSAVVPFNYLSLVWATIAGFLVWQEVPTASLLVGSAVVVLSGLYIFWRETVQRARAPGGTVAGGTHRSA